MEANKTLVIDNAIKGIVYNQVNGAADVTTYRVVLRDAITDYRNVKQAVGEGDDATEELVRSEVSVISYLVPRNVFLAQVLNKLPLLARIYKAELEKFKAVPENEGQIMDFVDYLNMFLEEGNIKLRLEKHVAGEVCTAKDGSEYVHTVDKISIELVDVAYGPKGQETADEIHKAEIAAMKAKALAALGIG